MQFEVLDHNKIGEMLLKAISEINEALQDLGIPFKFTDENHESDEVYDIYMAKKKNGKPKDDYPSE